MSRENVSPQFGPSRAYFPQLAKVAGGAAAAIFLDYLREQPRGKGEEWLLRTEKEIEQETGLSRQEQELARKQLRDRGLLAERLQPGAKEFEFCPDLKALAKKWQIFERLLFNDSPAAEMVTVRELPPTRPPGRDPAGIRFAGRGVLPNYRFSGPWQSEEQFQAFQKALLDYAIARGFSYPSGWAFKIIDGLSKGIISPYWDEFLAGVPFDSTQRVQRDWEVEPGVPYPAFEEERIQYYIHKGEPLDAAVARARADLRNPERAGDLWDGFLRRCDRWAEDALKAKQLGVKVPYLPPSFSEKQPISAASVANKLAAIAPQPELPETDSPPSPPPLETLQTLYNSPLGRAIAQRQIAEHPEWGYKIVEGCVVDLEPF